jgi:hypothetical protein
VFASLASGYTGLRANLARSGFRDLAQGSWLTLWAKSVYNVDRPLAAAAAGTLRLTNTSTVTFSKGIGQVTVKSSATGKTYTNTGTVTLGASPAFVDVPFVANEVGSASSAAPGAIDTLVTTMVGVTVTNAAAFVGTDDMADDALGALALAKLGSLSPNGPANAYLYIALTDPTTVPVLVANGLTTLTSVPITRVGVVADGNGGVSVYLANAAGPASAPDVAIVNARIQAAVTPLGIKATCFAANQVTIAVSYSAWLKGSGLTNAGAISAFAAKLVAYFGSIPLGGVILPPATSGVVSPNAIEGMLFAASPGVVKAVVTLPGVDVALTADQVPVLGAVTPTVTIL